jgi:lipoprotein-releasing system ATP-binding protein
MSTTASTMNTLSERSARGTTAPHANFPTSKTAEISSTNVSTEIQLQALNVTKSYRKESLEIPVLNGVDLEVRCGEFLSIIGQSGSGKSTLLHLLATLDAPSSGEIHFWKHRIDNLAPRLRDRLRNEEFGMIFQFYHLLPELTALENVLMPFMIRQSWLGYMKDKRKHEKRAKELLDMVGLSHRLKHRPREMSGGEMQRTAIARALMSDPKVLFADEPTGNLDSASGEDILKILRTLNREHHLSIIMVTHDNSLATKADRIVRLAAGKVVAI